MTDIEIQKKYLIKPTWIVEHKYTDTNSNVNTELLVVKLIAYRQNALYRFMFRNDDNVILDTTVPTNTVHDPVLFLKGFCATLTEQSRGYAHIDSGFAFNYINQSAVWISEKGGSTRYFICKRAYNKDRKIELSLHEIVHGKEVPLDETIVMDEPLHEYEGIIKCLEKNGIEVSRIPEGIND